MVLVALELHTALARELAQFRNLHPWDASTDWLAVAATLLVSPEDIQGFLDVAQRNFLTFYYVRHPRNVGSNDHRIELIKNRNWYPRFILLLLFALFLVFVTFVSLKKKTVNSATCLTSPSEIFAVELLSLRHSLRDGSCLAFKLVAGLTYVNVVGLRRGRQNAALLDRVSQFVSNQPSTIMT
jgi:hypothetical protein